jgi:hypothetical protein
MVNYNTYEPYKYLILFIAAMGLFYISNLLKKKIVSMINKKKDEKK